MVLAMTTQDGVLNLQAKNLHQQSNGMSISQDLQQADGGQSSVDFNSIFSPVATQDLHGFRKIVRLNLSSNRIFNVNS
jgi:hypothetical protein